MMLANQAFGDELFNGTRIKIRKRNRHCRQSLSEARLEPSTSCDLAGGKSLQNQHPTQFKTLKAGARRGGLAPPRKWEKAVRSTALKIDPNGCKRAHSCLNGNFCPQAIFKPDLLIVYFSDSDSNFGSSGVCRYIYVEWNRMECKRRSLKRFAAGANIGLDLYGGLHYLTKGVAI